MNKIKIQILSTLCSNYTLQKNLAILKNDDKNPHCHYIIKFVSSNKINILNRIFFKIYLVKHMKTTKSNTKLPL